MNENSADPVARQAAAYNRRDLDAFLSCYARDAVIEDGMGNVLMRGHDAMRRAYRELFRASPTLHAEIATRIRVGEYVIDEERVTGRRGAADEIHAVAIYHVANGVIDHVRLIH